MKIVISYVNGYFHYTLCVGFNLAIEKISIWISEVPITNPSKIRVLVVRFI